MHKIGFCEIQSDQDASHGEKVKAGSAQIIMDPLEKPGRANSFPHVVSQKKGGGNSLFRLLLALVGKKTGHFQEMEWRGMETHPNGIS